jgi:hypothetical protein
MSQTRHQTTFERRLKLKPRFLDIGSPGLGLCLRDLLWFEGCLYRLKTSESRSQNGLTQAFAALSITSGYIPTFSNRG